VEHSVTIFLCGDVMTGRGIDQVLPHPSDPVLYESYIKNSQDYVLLAEKANGPILQPVNYEYIWGTALGPMQRADCRIINLETSITYSENHMDKGINYRMHPENIPCLTVAKIDCCALANNHILDWGPDGLTETLETLEKGKIAYAGAGRNRADAQAPGTITIEGKGRVLVFSIGLPSSGIPPDWKASERKPGVNLLSDFTPDTIQYFADQIACLKQPGDITVASIHWGGNWGYEIPEAQKELAHWLIDGGKVDIIHGHSSHHVKALEIYNKKLIVYGCGDFLNDYEGISGYESYRDDLGLMYFVQANQTNGQLISLKMVPTQIKNFRINQPKRKDRKWLKLVMNRESRRFGTKFKWIDDHTFGLV